MLQDAVRYSITLIFSCPEEVGSGKSLCHNPTQGESKVQRGYIKLTGELVPRSEFRHAITFRVQLDVASPREARIQAEKPSDEGASAPLSAFAVTGGVGSPRGWARAWPESGLTFGSSSYQL